MSTITFEQLSQKEVISCSDCKRLGFITDLIINMPQVEDNDVIYTQHYKTMAGWAFQAGIGIKMADKISVGVHYNSLGSIKVKGKAELDGALANSTYIGSRFSLLRIYPSMFSIRLGYHF